MAILPQNYMEATVVLGITVFPNQVTWVATGFIVGRYEGLDEKGQKKYTTYLITNKHVVKNCDVLHLQFNSTTGTSLSTITLKKGEQLLFSEHPDSEVDIIANIIDINCAIEKGAIVSFFHLDDESLN